MTDAERDWKAERCGHNFPPVECIAEACGYRDALDLIRRQGEEIERWQGQFVDQCNVSDRLRELLAEARRVCQGYLDAPTLGGHATTIRTFLTKLDAEGVPHG